MGLVPAPVLPHEGGGRLGNGHDRHGQKGVQLVVAVPARHAGGAEGVDVALHKHVGEGGQRLLDACGCAHGEHTLQLRHADAQVPPADAVGALLPRQSDEHQRRRESLGDDGCQGHALHAHAELHHKHKIQHRVGQRGEHQEEQRTAGIPHRAENRAANIVQQQAGNTAEVQRQVLFRFAEDVLGGLHHPQHGPNQHKPHRRGRNAQKKSHRHSGLHGSVQPLLIMRTVALGNQHPRAHRQAVAQGDEHVDDAARGAHGRQGLLAHILPHHHRVHRVVQLLKQQPDSQRHRKAQKMPPDIPTGHVRVFACHDCHILLCACCFKHSTFHALCQSLRHTPAKAVICHFPVNCSHRLLLFSTECAIQELYGGEYAWGHTSITA